MNKFYIILVVALFTLVGTTNAQTPTLKAYEKAARKAMAKKDFYSAWKYYTITLEIDSQRIDNMYQLGESARLFKSYEVAQDAYQKVLDSEQKADYPLTEFWLAKVMRSQENYAGAILHFQKFKNTYNNVMTPKSPDEEMQPDYAAMAAQEIQYCEWATEKVASPKGSYKISPFGKGINTPGTEFAPVEHQEQVYYSALGYDQENFCPKPNSDVTRLYTSTTSDTGNVGQINWSDPVDEKFVAHTSFNNDGSRVYFTVCNRRNASEFDCIIYYREKDANAMWGPAVKLPAHINREGTTSTQPSIGFDKVANKEQLFFVSDRLEGGVAGRGDLNIYCSNIEADGTISNPFKLNINTPEDDITPFFQKETNTLYFSSKGYEGYGGFDILKVEPEGSSFGTPQPMEYPLNSSYDDIYFSTDESMSNSYFSSNRLGVTFDSPGMETCCNDIFKLEIYKVDLIARTFNVIDNTELDSCTVILIDKETGLEVARETNTGGNAFSFELDFEKEYKLVASHEGRWTTIDDHVSTKGLSGTTTIERDLPLRPEIDLIATTFEKETEQELIGCTFTLINMTTGDTLSEEVRLNDNRFTSLLEFGYDYKIVGSKDYYLPDEAEFTTKFEPGKNVPQTIRIPLYLELPDFTTSVSLYFDNDEPDSNTTVTFTNRSYDVVYLEYVREARMNRFIRENSKGEVGDNKLKAELETVKFFEEEVKEGMRQLERFAKILEVHLNTGRVYKMEIEGYASPRAPSLYNIALTKRRVSSVENYLRRYNNGALNGYIDNGNLKIKLVPKGEEPSAGLGIPSKFGDPRSIYSISASEQRKVEIVGLKRIDNITR